MQHIFQKGKLVLSGNLVVNDQQEILLLFKIDHQHWETPGGKVRLEECLDPVNPTVAELKRVAKRELYEELGNQIKIKDLKYFGKVNFTVPDGREAVVHKFLTRIISGQPRIGEPEVFSDLKYLPIDKLGDYPISPDLKLLLPRLKDLLKK